jgi:hypothetical protein
MHSGETADGTKRPPEERDQYIPVRKSDILRALTAPGAFGSETEHEQFQQFCRMLGSIYHYEYFEQLERLRDDYFYFNPDLDPRVRFEQAEIDRIYADLSSAFFKVVQRANFIEVPHAEIERAYREDAMVHVKIHAPADDFREIRFFRRGKHREIFDVPIWFGFRKRPTEIEVYDDVVMFVATRFAEPGHAEPRKRRPARSKVRSGAVLIKYFKHIASADLNALFPNVRILMSLKDKLMLGVPALVGFIPIVLKLASTLTVLFLVAGFYLGVSGAIKDDEVAGAFAALSGLVALGAFFLQQWIKFQRQTLIHHKNLTDNVYFRNINNNAGIFDYIIGSAEEQECKEAFLAYYFLQNTPSPPTKTELDRRIETWLRENFGVALDFEVGDALHKLERLGLLQRTGGRLTVLPLGHALARLDRVWDGYFGPKAANAAPAPASK